MEFIVSASTDIGKKAVNQDSLFVRKITTDTENMVFAVVCDGMGGHEMGEVASAAVINAFSEWMYTSLPVLVQDGIEDHVIQAQWFELLSEQNERIREYGSNHGCQLGTTVTALLLTESRFYLLNIGDSRAYRITDEVQQLTYDHTLLANEVRLGNITAEQAETAPIRNVLTKCVGINEEISPDMFFGDIASDAVFLMCTDGFRHLITEEELVRFFSPDQNASDADLKRGEEHLIGLNKLRGESDNISVITVLAREKQAFNIVRDITYIHCL